MILYICDDTISFPFFQGICCSDGQHCCPRGYTCNDQHGTCVKDGGNDALPYIRLYLDKVKVRLTYQYVDDWTKCTSLCWDIFICVFMKKNCWFNLLWSLFPWVLFTINSVNGWVPVWSRHQAISWTKVLVVMASLGRLDYYWLLQYLAFDGSSFWYDLDVIFHFTRFILWCRVTQVRYYIVMMGIYIDKEGWSQNLISKIPVLMS